MQRDVDRLDAFGLEHFSAAVKYLATAEKSAWNRPHAAKLTGQGDLYEIRFKSNRTQCRALGVFVPGLNEFVITLIASKKQDVYQPRDAFDIANRRAKQALSDSLLRITLQIDGEDFPPVPE